MSEKKNWFKVAALAAGLVGTAIGVAAVVKKNKEQQSERIQFDSFEDELLMDAVEAQEEVGAVVAEMQEAYAEEEGMAEVVAQTKPLEELGVADDEEEVAETEAIEETPAEKTED